MKALTVYKLLIIACTFFLSEEANAVPIDYEAVYSVKLMQADGTLRAKLEKNEESGLEFFSLQNRARKIFAGK